MITLESVSKRYGQRYAVENVSFRVHSGEIVGFLGPNGAGKTTTLRMIAGYIAPTSGRVSVGGFDMVQNNHAAAELIGYLPERPPLYDTLDVTTYLAFVAKIKGVKRTARRQELDRVITACHLQAVAKSEIFKLSKGYRQRLGLAQAIIGQPKVLLLDEPTNGLDPGQIHETRDLIQTIGRAEAVLLSTHILPEVTRMCDRIAIINHGRLLAIDTPAGLSAAVAEAHIVTLATNTPRDALNTLLAQADGIRSFHVLAGNGAAGDMTTAECHTDGAPATTAAIARMVSKDWDLFALEQRPPTLENIFLHYVQQSKVAA